MIPPASSDAALLRESLAMLEKHHIVLALTTGPVAQVSRWRDAISCLAMSRYFCITASSPT